MKLNKLNNEMMQSHQGHIKVDSFIKVSNGSTSFINPYIHFNGEEQAKVSMHELMLQKRDSQRASPERNPGNLDLQSL